MRALAAIDTSQVDRQLGICAIPLFDFLTEDFELMQRGDLEETRKFLTEKGIYQYFCPSPDEFALALVERGVRTGDGVAAGLEGVDKAGHIIGDPTLVNERRALHLIDALRERGLVVEVDGELVVSGSGTEFRAKVRGLPKEGLVFK